jgi:hypothetical protein
MGVSTIVGRAVLEHLIWQLDQSFQDKKEHSLLANLSSVTGDDLDQVVPGGGRTMRDLIFHCGAVKVMHVNHAFGDRSHTFWTTWDREQIVAEASFESLHDWLEETHALAIEAVMQLKDDEELLVRRPTYWGEQWETRLLVDAIAIHDVYHAGEINHLRALIHQYSEGRL